MLADQLKKDGVESIIAILFLHSYANPDHEQRAKRCWNNGAPVSS